MGWDDRAVNFAIFSYYLIVLLDSMKSLGDDRVAVVGSENLNCAIEPSPFLTRECFSQLMLMRSSVGMERDFKAYLSPCFPYLTV